MKKRTFSIKTMGYQEALAYDNYNHSNPNGPNYAIISVKEEIKNPFQKRGNCLATLNLAFSDCTPAVKIEGTTLMTKEDAQRIHDFVENLPKEVELLIIHCHAGHSRSVAIGDAILFVKEGIKKAIYESEVVSPNKYIYYTLLETYGMENQYWKVWYEKEKKTFKGLKSPSKAEKDLIRMLAMLENLK